MSNIPANVSVIEKKVRMCKPRTLEGNEKIVEEINSAIDEVVKYLPAQQFYCVMRTFFTTAKKELKKYCDENAREIFHIDSNYGEINIITDTESKTCSKGDILRVFDGLGWEQPKESDFKETIRHILNVGVNCAKVSKEVLDAEKHYVSALKKYIENCEINNQEDFEPDEINFIIGIVARQKMLQDLYEDRSNYLRATSKVREIFTRATKRGTFPLTYIYRDIAVYWDSSIYKIPFPTKIGLYLRERDRKNGSTQWEEYLSHAKTRSAAENPIKSHIKYIYQDMDYMAFDVQDLEEEFDC